MLWLLGESKQSWFLIRTELLLWVLALGGWASGRKVYLLIQTHSESKHLDLSSSYHLPAVWPSISHLTSQSFALLPVIWYLEIIFVCIHVYFCKSNYRYKLSHKIFKRKYKQAQWMLVSFLISSPASASSTLRCTDKVYPTILLTEDFSHRGKMDLSRRAEKWRWKRSGLLRFSVFLVPTLVTLSPAYFPVISWKTWPSTLQC